jgi:hypothetical protein
MLLILAACVGGTTNAGIFTMPWELLSPAIYNSVIPVTFTRAKP